jgi:MFS superfamily sulfate permease-like transporter
MLKPYRNLLIAEGIEPTLTDELLHGVSIILAISFLCGIVTIGLGFALSA